MAIKERTGHSLRLVSGTMSFNRSNIYYNKKEPDRRTKPEDEDLPLLEKIKKVIAGRGTYGYRRVCTRLRKRFALKVNKNKVYRIMKRFGLLIKRFRKSRRIHRGRIAVQRSDQRWCSDITGIVSWNGERGRFAFILDCCDREVLAWRFERRLQWVDLAGMLDEAIEYRLGDRPLAAARIEFLHDNGPEYIAYDFKNYIEKDLGLIDCCTPIQSPQSNGMAEAFIGTLKRDYVYENELEDFKTVRKMIPAWIEDYNSVAPHSALGMMAPREFINNKAA